MRKTKFYALVLAAAMAVGGFAGCTDDENDNKKYDENGNEIVDEPGNTPGGDVELKEKRVAKIWYGEVLDDGTVRYNESREFTYQKNRIIEITKCDYATNGTEISEWDYTVEYGTTEVVVLNGAYEKSSFEMSDGRAVTGWYDFGAGEHGLYAFEYTDGYLSRLEAQTEDEGRVYWKEEIDFKVENGLWTEANQTEGYGTEEYNMMCYYEMSEVENNLSVDLYYLFVLPTEEYPFMLGVVGKRMKYLPEKITGEMDGLTATEEFEYTLNEEGYVTDIKCHWIYPEEEGFTLAYKIEYE